MTASIPAAKTLSIAANDSINYLGQTYTVTNVSSSDNGQGLIIYSCTINASGSPILSCSYANCVESSKGSLTTGSASTTRIWVQSGAA